MSTYTDLVLLMAARWRVSRRTAAARINALSKVILSRAGRGITVYRLGHFYTMHRKPYRKRSPRTGEIETIPAARILKFKPAKTTRRPG